jgi:hypothetical protein
MLQEKAPLSLQRVERKFKVIQPSNGEVLYVGGLEDAFDFFCEQLT